MQGEVYNRSWADLSLFGLRPGEIRYTSASAESVSVWLREHRQVYDGGGEVLSNGTLGVLAQGSAGVPGSGYSTPTQGTGFYGSQAITRMHEMSPVPLMRRTMKTSLGSLEESDSCGLDGS